ncbi:MAG: hypothetical protein OEM51_01755 [Gammaproteobacteria bacterium]|nr:hypothetical protein [Gammaproteobacteria bacterium]
MIDMIDLKIFVIENWGRYDGAELHKQAERKFGPCRDAVDEIVSNLMVVR